MERSKTQESAVRFKDRWSTRAGPPGTRRPTASWLWIAIVIAGLIMVRQVSVRLSEKAISRPGETRGDLKLVADSLPAAISGWNQTAFTPPENPDLLAKGQYWWVHSWTFQRQDVTALITLDQLGLNHWHELTHCYQGLGWDIEDRRIVRPGPTARPGARNRDSEPSASWEYVIARMKKPVGEYGLVVFSTFYEDGSPVDALPMGLDHSWDPPEKLDLRLQNRLQARHSAPEHTRALQCQVLCQSQAPFSEDTVAGIIELHEQTRQQFRLAWLRNKTHQSPTTQVKAPPGDGWTHSPFAHAGRRCRTAG